MNIELLVRVLESALKEKTTGKVLSFTPSVVNGRRYIGVKFENEEYLIQIDSV